MAEPPITEADIERMKRGFELFNKDDFDALEDFMAPDVVMERVGGLPPIHGWPAVRANMEPDSFEYQRIEPLEWVVNEDKALIHTRIRSRGAGSGIEFEIDGWLVWTVADHVVNRIQTFQTEDEARAAAGLGQNQSRDRIRTD